MNAFCSSDSLFNYHITTPLENIMPKSLEELKKIINEQETALLIKSRHHLNRMEQIALHKLQERLIDEEGLDDLPSKEQLEQLQNLHKQTSSYAAKGPSAEVAKIFENFAKEFGKENIKNNNLSFPDDPHNIKANDFFQRQANEGHAFLFKQCGCDNYAFSDGKGHYQMGSKAEIISYCKQNNINQVFNEEPAVEQESSPMAMVG